MAVWVVTQQREYRKCHWTAHGMARAANFMLCAFSHNWKVRCLSQAGFSLCVSKLSLFPQNQPFSAKSALTLQCNWFVPLDVILSASPHDHSVIYRGSPKQNATFQNKTTNNIVTFYYLKRRPGGYYTKVVSRERTIKREVFYSWLISQAVWGWNDTRLWQF